MQLTQIRKVIADTNLRQNIDEIIAYAKNSNWAYWFEGYPVANQEVIDLMVGIREGMSTVKFFPNSMKHISIPIHDENGVYLTTKSIRVVNTMFVYMDEFPFQLGSVGYGDYAVKVDRHNEKPKYMVCSRKIQNAKFAQGRDQHNMIMSSDLNKSIRNAFKYFVPYTTLEISRAYFRDMQTQVESVGRKAYNELYQSVSNIQAKDNLINEILSLIKQGVTFNTQGFKEVAEKLPALKAEFDYQQTRVIPALFVRFRKVGNDTMVDVEHILDVKKGSGGRGEARTYTIDDLPQDIKGSIAVLNILEDGQYVAGVGQRVDAEQFWIERG